MKRFLYIFIVLLCSQVVWASKPIQILVQLQAPHSPYVYEYADVGRKNHVIAKTSVRTATSVFATGKFLAKLPDMAIQMAAKMPKAKLWLRFRNLDETLSKSLLKKLDDLPDGGHKFLDDFAHAPDEILKKFLDNPELVEAWNILKNIELKTDIKWLEKVSNYRNLGLQLIEQGTEIMILQQSKEIARIADNILQIKIPYDNGWAKQSVTKLAIEASKNVETGVKLYRIGKLGQSHAAEAQFWSLENPLNIKNLKDFAKKYGIPEENLKGSDLFVEIGKLKSGSPFISREAPGFGNNIGGDIEIVVPAHGVQLETFHTIKF